METNKKDRLLPYKWLYLVSSAVIMLINAGLGSYFFLIGEMERFQSLPNEFKAVFIILLLTSLILIPASVVFMFLDKPISSFISSLLAAIIITYVGFFLIVREPEIPFKTVLSYQFSSLLLPVFSAVLWAVWTHNVKKNKKIVFAKTERDKNTDTPSILD